MMTALTAVHEHVKDLHGDLVRADGGRAAADGREHGDAPARAADVGPRGRRRPRRATRRAPARDARACPATSRSRTGRSCSRCSRAGESRIAAAGDGEDVRSTAGIVAALGAHGRAGRRARRPGRLPGRVARRRRARRSPRTSSTAATPGRRPASSPGVLAGPPLFAVLDGDASLRRRPMGRVAEPLRRDGRQARGPGRRRRCLPLAITGRADLTPDHATTRRSRAPRSSRRSCSPASRPTARRAVTEAVATRDHTERMLRARGVAVDEATDARRRGTRSRLDGPDGRGRDRRDACPADPSGAAFWLVAGVDPSRRRAAPRRGEHEPDAACHHRHPAAHGRRHRGARSPGLGRGGRRAARRPRRPVAAGSGPSTCRPPTWRRRSTRSRSCALAAAVADRDDPDPRRGRAPAQGIRPDRRDRGRARRPSAREVRVEGDDIEIQGGTRRWRAPSPRPTTITGSR